MKTCGKCNKDNRDEAKYCRFCGEALVQASPQKELIATPITPTLTVLNFNSST